MDKLLFTGGTGFLGQNVKPLLDKRYEVITCGITPDDLIKANLAKEIPTLSEHYDIVLHACGKAHLVPQTDVEKKSFFDVNYHGTVNLCVGLEAVGVPRSLVFVSTVAVYGCDYGENIDETFPLEGNTPYAKSKIMAEQYLTEWCNKNGVILGIIRPPLLVGKNAPGNLGAMINGIKSGRYFSIAGGKARKSVLMAEDIATLVPLLAAKGGVYNVCDDYNPSFRELEFLISSHLKKKMPISIPYWMAKSLAVIGDNIGLLPIDSIRLNKITSSLTYSNAKAKRELGWQPTSVIDNFEI